MRKRGAFCPFRYGGHMRILVQPHARGFRLVLRSNDRRDKQVYAAREVGTPIQDLSREDLTEWLDGLVDDGVRNFVNRRTPQGYTSIKEDA